MLWNMFQWVRLSRLYLDPHLAYCKMLSHFSHSFTEHKSESNHVFVVRPTSDLTDTIILTLCTDALHRHTHTHTHSFSLCLIFILPVSLSLNLPIFYPSLSPSLYSSPFLSTSPSLSTSLSPSLSLFLSPSLPLLFLSLPSPSMYLFMTLSLSFALSQASAAQPLHQSAQKSRAERGGEQSLPEKFKVN